MTKSNQQKNKKTNSVLRTRIKKIKWYIQIPLVLLLLTLGFQVLRSGVNTYNVSLLDKAERKMLSIDVPHSDHTSYERSCSYKSTQNLWSGFPSCRVIRADVYNGENTDTIFKTVTKFVSTVDGANVDNESKKRLFTGESEEFVLNRKEFVRGLHCYLSLQYKDGGLLSGFESAGLIRGKKYLAAVNSCYKSTLFKLYPES